MDHQLAPGRHDTLAWPWPPGTALSSSIEVRLSGTRALAGPFELWAHSAVDARPEARGIDDALLPLVRGVQGFEVAPTRTRVLRIAVDDSLAELEARVELGIEWRGLVYACRSWPARALREPAECALLLPADATAWWGLGPRSENRREIALPADGIVDVRFH